MATDSDLDAAVRRVLGELLAEGAPYTGLPLVNPSTSLLPDSIVDAIRAPLEDGITDLDEAVGTLTPAVADLEELTTSGRLSEAQQLATIAQPLRIATYQGRPSLGDVTPTMDTPPTVAVTGPSGTSPIAGTTLAQSTSLVSRRSGRYATQTLNSHQYHQNFINNPSTSRSAGVIEFSFFGDEFAVKFYNALVATSGVRMFVDGQLAGTFLSPAGSTTGQPYWARVTFASPTLRRIRLEMLANGLFGGITVPAGASVTPASDRLPRCAVYGDSWVGGALGLSEEQLIFYRLGRHLGWETARLGHGGSGYAQVGAGAGVRYEDPVRVAELIAYAPEFAVVLGSINNDSTPPETVYAAALDLYSQIREGSPATRVIVVGPQVLGSVTPPARLLVRDAVKQAALESPNVVQFIDPIAGAWVTGTGRDGAPQGDGNADTWIGSDGSHPTAAGCDGYALRIAREIVATA